MMKDPICGMNVDDEQFTLEIEGKKYFFCSSGCLETFKGSSDEDAFAKYVYDLVIIGAGPAGLTAAVYASVLKIGTLLITKNIGGQAVDRAKINNYTGFDFISGKELVEKIEHQFLHEHYLDHKIDEVVKIARKGGIFEIMTKGQCNITAYAIIIATGIEQKKLNVPGEERLAGFLPNIEFCRDLVKVNEIGEIIINPDCSTNVEGIFACGDVTNCFGKRIIIASGEGAKASLSVKKYLLSVGIK